MKLLVVLSAVMACALARPGFSYNSWALPGGLVAAPVAPVAHAYAAPIAPTFAVGSWAAPAVTTYSAIPALAPWAAPVAAPAEAAAKSEDSTAVEAAAPAEPASDDAVAVEAAPADAPAQTEAPAATEPPTPAPAEETPAPAAPAPAPEAPVAQIAHLALPVPAWTPALAPVPLFAAPAPVVVAAPVTKSQYHAQDELGNTAYGHAEPGAVHSAVQDAAGNRVGSFSYLNPTDGQVHRTDYVADGLGYRVAANDLPIASAEAPLPVAETPEVAAARAAHLAARDSPVAPAELPQPVAETPEVAAARAAHLAAHSRARRSAVTTPASTSPLVTPVVAHVAAPLAYAAPWAYAAPLATPVIAAPYAAHLGLPATLTTIVNTPGHAVSYRID